MLFPVIAGVDYDRVVELGALIIDGAAESTTTFGLLAATALLA